VASDFERDRGGTPTLEEFILACQKSLARAAQGAREETRMEADFVRGERPLYVVDRLEFEIHTGIRAAAYRDDTHHSVLLDLEDAPDRRSVLRFTVEHKPLEFETGPRIALADLDPLGANLPIARLRSWVLDAEGSAWPGQLVTLHVYTPESTDEAGSVSHYTNAMGRVEFEIDPNENLVEAAFGPSVSIDLREFAEYWVRASCAVPESPEPLRSEVLHLTNPESRG